MKNRKTVGHIAAFITIFIWGTTFISTKVLLVQFQPIEILLYRFALGFLALLLVCPRRLKGTTRKQEFIFAMAGLCGICLYYLLENVALTYTLASNVGVIISVAPFFTAILSHSCRKYLGDSENHTETLRWKFFLGFFVAIVGIALISLGGSEISWNPKGDLLAVAAAFVWACYSVLTRKISGFGYSTILTTRRVFFYGILFMIPAIALFDVKWSITELVNPVYALNILFLGLGASALCFVIWNFAVKVLGAVKTSVYIYMVPVITVIASVIVLQEEITVCFGIGILLTLIGLFISEKV